MKLSGYYKASLEDFGICFPLLMTVGTTFRAQSGTPYEALAGDFLYGANEIFLLPRGAGGRTPWNWQWDLNFGVGYDFGNQTTLEFFVSLYNVTNNLTVIDVDPVYTFDSAQPIVGGDRSQLASAHNINGTPVAVNPNYGNATGYQSPFYGQFGLRFKF
jgi:hypothetical protein